MPRHLPWQVEQLAELYRTTLEESKQHNEALTAKLAASQAALAEARAAPPPPALELRAAADTPTVETAAAAASAAACSSAAPPAPSASAAERSTLALRAATGGAAAEAEAEAGAGGLSALYAKYEAAVEEARLAKQAQAESDATLSQARRRDHPRSLLSPARSSPPPSHPSSPAPRVAGRRIV